MDSSIVLLSGGLDSSVNLALAVKKTKVLLALTLDYGQKAAPREIEAASNFCRHFGVDHKVLTVPYFAEMTTSALLSQDNPPEPERGELDSEKAFETARAVWVPNRNGLFINLAACYADELDCRYIVVGFNREEATTFPDNSQAFIEAVNGSLGFSCRNKVEVTCYTTDMNKREIVYLGKKINFPFRLLWSCYHGGEKPCGRCESCQRLQRALEEADKEC